MFGMGPRGKNALHGRMLSLHRYADASKTLRQEKRVKRGAT